MSEFDKFAKSYDDILNNTLKYSSSYFAKRKVEEVYNICKQKNIFPNNILDFGCGIGKNTKLLSETFKTSLIYGVDVSKDSIKIANKLNLNNVHFNSYDGNILPYNNIKFDLIFISNVFHHIEHNLHLEILKQLYKILDDNGIIILFEHNTLNPMTLKIVNECELDKDAKLLHFWYTRKLFIDIGMKNNNINFIFFIPPTSKKFLFLEKYLKKVPLGAQYYIIGSK